MPALAAPALAPSSGRERLIVLGLAVALTAALTYPTLFRFGSAGRLDTGDGRFSIWNVAWVAHALVDEPSHLVDANIFYPHTGTLTYSELNLVAGVMAVPAYLITRNPIAAHNSAVVISLLITFVAMWALVRRLTKSSPAGVIAATAYTFSAFTSSHTAEIQLLMLFGFPLAMLAFHRLIRQPTLASAGWLSGALAFAALACGYYGVFAGAMVSFATIWWATRSRHYWMAIGAALLITGGLLLPVVGPYFQERASQGISRDADFDELQLYSANARAYLTSGTRVGMSWTWKLAPFKEVLFPGLVVVGFAAVALVTAASDGVNRKTLVGYGVIAVLALWASFGPSLGLYTLLSKVIPGMSLLRAPARFGVVVIFALAVLAGFGFARLEKRNKWLAVLALGGLVGELWVAWPIREMPALPKAYAMLATLPRGGVVEFFFPYKTTDFHNHTWAMLRSTSNWQPLVNGYSDYTPPDFSELATPINAFPDLKSFEIMRTHKVRYVVIRLAEYGANRQILLDRFPPYDKYLRLLTDDQDVRLYQIVSWPAAPDAQ